MWKTPEIEEIDVTLTAGGTNRGEEEYLDGGDVPGDPSRHTQTNS